MNDPGAKELMPPGKPMAQMSFAPALGIANLLVISGGGWLLWRFGRRRTERKESDLESVFE